MSNFNYNTSQFNLYIRNMVEGKSISLGIFLKDLFAGSKGLIKYNASLYLSDAYGEGNAPLVDTSKKVIGDSVREKLALLFPAELMDGDKPDSVYRALTAHVGQNYSLGNKIINVFNASPQETLKKFYFSCRQFLADTELVVDRVGLAEYFKGIRQIIVPQELSQSASLKYGELLENGKLAVILSRIILSMIFGFKPKREGERHYSPSPEVLNRIWCTPVVNVQTSTIQMNNVEEQCSYALGLYESGDYKNSYILLNKLISSKFFTALPPSKIKWSVECAYAEQLLSAKGCEKNVSEAVSFLSSLKDNPDAKYLLSEYYNGVFCESKDALKANKYLETSALEGSVKAILELLSIRVDSFAKGISETSASAEKLQEQLIRHESELKSSEKTRFDYLRGLLLEAKGMAEDAAEFFERAAATGHEGAQRKTARRKRTVPTRAITFNGDGKNLCIINGNGQAIGAFIRALPSDFEVITVRESEYESRGVKHCDGIWGLEEILGSGGLENLAKYEKITAAFFSDNEDSNIDDTLELLDHLYNTSLDLLNMEKSATVAELMKRIDIFLAADYESASLLVDANINDMRESIYFRVHVCDEKRDAAHDLLHRFPLFIPFLKKTNRTEKAPQSSNVVIFGSSPLASRIASEACAVAYMGENHPVSVSVAGENIKPIENRFFRDAPGLYGDKATRKIRSISPRFFEFDLNSPEICRAFSRGDGESNELFSILSSANYFAVAIGDDCENIRFAINLRRWILKSAPAFDRKPFIAVYCRDAKTARLINTIPIQNQKQGEMWYNKFDICCFGMTASLYSYNALLCNNALEKQAFYLHSSYYGENQKNAVYDYFCSQYNRDSSKISAIALRYRLFLAGCYAEFESTPNFSVEKDAALADRYDAWLNDKRAGNLEFAAALEQSRWNSFMLCRGWEPSSPDQVRNYAEQASGSQHKNMLAKLHPHICEWENLARTEHEIILNILKRKKADIKNPQKVTEESLSATARAIKEGCIKI